MKTISAFFVVAVLFFQTAAGQDLNNLKGQKPFAVKGNILTSLNYNGAANPYQTYQPFSYLVSINLSPSIYGFSLPLSFTYSRMNKTFTHPFTRFGISPTYKWIRLDLGHRSSNFSKYTISGQKFFGGGVMLTPGKFRLGFMYGKFRRDRGFRTVTGGAFEHEDYSRRGYAAKIGVGSRKNFVDLVFMKIADDLDNFTTDTTGTFLPESNVAGAAVSKFSFGKHIKFHAEIAASLFTRNLASDSFDLGEDVKPILRKAAGFSQVNTSSSLAFAKDAGIDLTFKTFSFGLTYKRIDPGYKSIGANYIRNDFENYAFKTGIHLKKAHFNASVGLLRDNLKNTKAKQTDRIVSRFNLTVTPAKFLRITSTFSNFSTQQSEGRLPLNDTIRLYQVNKNFSVIPQLTLSGKKATHVILLNYTFSNMVDKNILAAVPVPVVSNVAFLQYNFQKTKSTWSVSANINYTQFKTGVSTITNTGPTVGYRQALFGKKANINLSATYLSSKNNSVAGSVISLRSGFSYRIGKKQSLQFSFNFTKSNYPGSSQLSNYTNNRGNIAYTYHL